MIAIMPPINGSQYAGVHCPITATIPPTKATHPPQFAMFGLPPFKKELKYRGGAGLNNLP